jgi:hypothetical protein
MNRSIVKQLEKEKNSNFNVENFVEYKKKKFNLKKIQKISKYKIF